MKKFDAIADSIFRTLLEAPVPPVAATPEQQPTTPAAGLNQTGQPPQPLGGQPEQVPQTSQETTNWETTLLDMAKNAIMTVRDNPNLISDEDAKVLTTPVTQQNKDAGIMAVLGKLQGKA